MIKGLRIKICGLRREEDMAHAVACGADYVGVIFAESPRSIEPDGLAEWLPRARGDAEVVGVFRDASFEQVVAAVERFDLDLVQLHGGETGERWLSLPVRLMEARPVGDVVAPSRFGGAAWADLLDTAKADGGSGGSGLTFPWELARPLSTARRIFLAGGLTPDNVAEAIERGRPFAVDVSSGVEGSPGIKNRQRVSDFIQAAREATT